MSVSDFEMLVVRSIRQSFEMNGAPGSAVHQDQNPFFITVTGSFDLLKTAKLVLANIDNLRELQIQRELNEAAERAKAAQEAALKGSDDLH
jgi:hypothetical protein